MLNLSSNLYHSIKGIGVEVWEIISDNNELILNDLYEKLSLQFHNLSNENKKEIEDFIYKLEIKKIVFLE